MIIGFGVDLIDMSRFKKSLEIPRFKQRIFSFSEIMLSPLHLAGHFAAREAFFKALDNQALFNYENLEVINEVNGKPKFQFFNELSEYCENKIIHLSISHTPEYAMAVVVIES